MSHRVLHGVHLTVEGLDNCIYYSNGQYCVVHYNSIVCLTVFFMASTSQLRDWICLRDSLASCLACRMESLFFLADSVRSVNCRREPHGPHVNTRNAHRSGAVPIPIPVSEIPQILPKMQRWVSVSMRVYAPIPFHHLTSSFTTHAENISNTTVLCCVR